MIRRLWGRLALAVASLLVGCAQLPVETVPLVTRQAALQFELSGRIAAADGGRSVSAGVDWRHGATDEWRFVSPIGQVMATIEAGPSGAVLYSAGRAPVGAASAEELMQQTIGVAPPLNRVVAWIQAVPPTGSVVREIDAQGRPVRLIDAGWVVEFLEYVGDEPQDRPRRLEISQGDARLRLVIDDWRALP
ncbi:MAG: outer membrane lipoprotein LolB [Zoogloeaceae bacterium]|nr:outer membrane lipoprotein LolB [Zoogloeaceae bacterium]